MKIEPSVISQYVDEKILDDTLNELNLIVNVETSISTIDATTYIYSPDFLFNETKRLISKKIDLPESTIKFVVDYLVNYYLGNIENI